MAKKNTTVKKDKKEILVPEEIKSVVNETIDVKPETEIINEENNFNSKEETIKDSNVEIAEEEINKVVEKPCNCKKTIVSNKQTFNEMFGYFWNGQIYGE